MPVQPLYRLVVGLGLLGCALPAASQVSAPPPAPSHDARPARNTVRVEAGGMALGGLGIGYERGIGEHVRLYAGYSPPLIGADQDEGFGGFTAVHVVPVGASYVQPFTPRVGAEVGIGTVLSVGHRRASIYYPQADSPRDGEGGPPEYLTSTDVSARVGGTLGLRFEEGRLALRGGVSVFPARGSREVQLMRSDVSGVGPFTLRPSLSAGFRF